MSRACVSAATLVCCIVLSGAGAAADTILHNGRIYTVDSSNRVVEAIAIRDGKILAVGKDEEILSLARRGTELRDLGGLTVTPGLIDAHGHLMELGRSLQVLDLVGTTSYEEVVDRVAKKVAETEVGDWIVGRGWDQNDWEHAAFPNHAALSAVSPGHPVLLQRVDGHAILANARAMEIAGVTRGTPDPDGGRILRDDAGDPAGVFIDNAKSLIADHVPASTPAAMEDAAARAIAECLRHGLTTVHEAGSTGAFLDVYKRMIDADRFDLRVYAMISSTDRRTIDRYFERGPMLGYGGGRLTVRCIKVYADGALGSRGAALLSDYRDDPGNAGLLLTSGERLQALTERALNAGFQVATHAIGDRANRMVLDAYAAALAAVPGARDPRLRIEHAQVIAPVDIPRFAALGVIPSMQATHATSDMYWAEERLGPDRIRGAYAWRSVMDTGSRIANGSDFPVEGVNPLWGLYAAITRKDHEGWPEGGWRSAERMTRAEALRSFTIDAAYAAFEEESKGSLEPGKYADLAVFSEDIMAIPPRELLDAEVLMTIVGGEVVYERGGE